ncbi:MAG TPA: AraC family transcriptional regulator [Flavobacterium sp.]|uniref:AraC family transcriptional regulator n=1 Tax=Flavobacterium sp. TaxID=239 RepID=UPI002B6DF8C3|nr:AraC family transcriptional regulator [Flavobacterium sp.]MCA0349342.1 AraC family transcriptional regulator [Bacteroidota bacterium]HPW97092.1 AraC family transcriptional regulator [Flavobacterium sp.]HQA73475.1 AraC family transcriptional regulator [Flavobacterium sp.]
MKLYIKNMVCNRCKMVVKSELEKLGLQLLSVELGEVEILTTISEEQIMRISKKLETFGFEILNDSNSKIIEKIKTILIDLVQNKNNDINITLSDYLIQNLYQDYSKLSNLFSYVEGISIEKYFINLKIEKVKELIVYDELSLSEIADFLNYSSVSHLSNQFKKVTGFSPSYFKKIKESKRKELDQL